jgi:hypothetical protein
MPTGKVHPGGTCLGSGMHTHVVYLAGTLLAWLQLVTIVYYSLLVLC